MKKNLWSLIKPPQFDGGDNVGTWASSSQNQACDEQTLGIILFALDDNFIHYINKANATMFEWNGLKCIFGDKAKHFKIFLKMQLYVLIM